MKKIILVLLIAGIIIETGYLLFINSKNQKNREIISPLAVITDEIAIISPTVINTYTPTPVPTVIQVIPKVSNEELKKTVEKVLDNTDGTYGIVIRNMKTAQEYELNGNREFHPASLYKLWVMAAAFSQIQNGRLDKTEVMSRDISFLNSEFDIDPTLAQQTEGTVSLKVEEALEQMITRSDNYAAMLLSERLKLSTVSKFLINNKLMKSKLGEPPVTTPNDITLFLEKLYKGDLADQEKSGEMIELLKRQQINNKLPKNLNSSIIIAHKTGELDTFSHDAGIVYTGKGDYIIVVMSETDNRNKANGKIAEISKAVFEYFN